MPGLGDLDAAVLGCLPRDLDGAPWYRSHDVADALGIDRDVARSVLARLRTRGLVEDDGERPQAFARTPRGEHVLERAGR